MTRAGKLKAITWTVTLGLAGLAAYQWSVVRLSDGELGPYELFPLLGLLAFTLMWSHYVSDAIRRWLKFDETVLHRYFTITAWAVLGLILLHPTIFWYRLWADGFGLPPGSYLGVYTDELARAALLLGSLSLAFEFHRKFKDASWWKYVEYANMAAMFAIFYHALTLGGEVAVGWFRFLWITYGITLALSIGYTIYHKRRNYHG